MVNPKTPAPAPKLQKGKREPKNAKALMFSRYHAVASETYPDIDYSEDYSAWADTMDGNDKAGDCVCCGTLNTRRLDSAVLDGVPAVFDIALAWKLYQTQNPGFVPGTGPHGYGSGDDQGMDMQTLWEWLLLNDVLDKKLVGFMKVDHTNMTEVQAGISLAGSLAVGATVSDTQQQEFPTKPWTWDPNGADPGGHCFLLAGHRTAEGKRVYRGVCWASPFDIEEDFLTNAMDEAWLLVWEDMLESKEFMAQMDVATFAADVSAATGQPFPVAVDPNPAPAPGPVPAPAPAPTPDPVPLPPQPLPLAPPVISEPASGATVTEAIVRLEGEGVPGSQVVLYDDQPSEPSATLATVNVDPDQGTWFAEGPLAQGVHRLYGVTMDQDGNSSAASVSITLTVAVPAPPAPTPESPEDKLAHFLEHRLLPHVRLHYEEYLELRSLAKNWVDSRGGE